MTKVKQRKGWRMRCDVGKRGNGWRMSYDGGEATESLENEQSSYVTGFSLTSPGEPPMVYVHFLEALVSLISTLTVFFMIDGDLLSWRIRKSLSDQR